MDQLTWGEAHSSPVASNKHKHKQPPDWSNTGYDTEGRACRRRPYNQDLSVHCLPFSLSLSVSPPQSNSHIRTTTTCSFPHSTHSPSHRHRESENILSVCQSLFLSLPLSPLRHIQSFLSSSLTHSPPLIAIPTSDFSLTYIHTHTHTQRQRLHPARARGVS
jgi:hypothetical protein